MSLITRVGSHILNGTFLTRLSREWRKRSRSLRTSKWTACGGRGKNIVVKIEGGARLRLFPDSVFCRMVYLGNLTRDEQGFFNRILRPGDCFVDVGANIGLFTVLAARRVGPKGSVHAFEPCTKQFARLEQNVRLNGFRNVNMNKAALSDKAGCARMRISTDGWDAWNTLGSASAGGLGQGQEEVTLLSWNEYARQNSLQGKITAMKIDAEGWEMHVLRGAEEMLQRADAPILHIEFNEETCRGAGTSCRSLYRYLEQLGFKLFLYDEWHRRLVPEPLRDVYPPTPQLPDPCLNIVAAKSLESVMARLA